MGGVNIDGWDLLTLAGALLIAAGLWLIFGWPAPLVWMGLVLMVAGIMGAR